MSAAAKAPTGPNGPQRPVRVMVSHRAPRATTNPYITMLDRALRESPDVDHRRFGWRTGVLGGYDLFHTHWTEALMTSASTPRRVLKELRLLALVLLMTLRRTGVVRTVHNVEPPSGLDPLARLVLRLVERATVLRIRLNESTALSPGPSATILHGHYVDWFAGLPRADPVPGRIAYTGLIRRYKGVERLVEVFGPARAEDPTLSLTVSGSPTTTELADTLRTLAGNAPGISLDLRYLSDADLVQAVTAAELVVLPYRFMHNSGSALAALSLDRPVLVPDNEVNRALAAEVGDGWVQLFTGDLTTEHLRSALTAVRAADLDRPDLSRRGWQAVAQQHRDAYLAALAPDRRPR